MSSSVDRPFQLEHVYPLGRDFPDELAAVLRLTLVVRWVNENSLDELQLRLGEIVYVHRRRNRDEAYSDLAKQNVSVPPIPAGPRSSNRKPSTLELPYFKRISETITQLRCALGAIENAAKLLPFIDIKHWEQISIVARSTSNLPREALNAYNVNRRVAELINFLTVLSDSIEVGTNVRASPRGKGRPGDKFLWVAIDLARLWKEISGQPIPTPRGVDRANEFTQPSTEFVHLALKMIDPQITPSEVVTAIRSAIKFGKDIDEQLSALETAVSSL